MSISKMHLSPKCVIKDRLIPCTSLGDSSPAPPTKHNNTRSAFFADGHIMHNQPNKTADFRVECWTHAPLEGILGGHRLLGAIACPLHAREPAPVTTNPESSLNWTELRSKNWSGGRARLPQTMWLDC